MVYVSQTFPHEFGGRQYRRPGVEDQERSLPSKSPRRAEGRPQLASGQRKGKNELNPHTDTKATLVLCSTLLARLRYLSRARRRAGYDYLTVISAGLVGQRISKRCD